MLSEPNIPTFKGHFDGEIIHSAQYKTAAVFEGKRVLVVGAGNSGCDIAVDAVHRAAKVDITVRHGFHFIPKYMFGKPSDLFVSKIKWSIAIEHFFGSRLMRIFTGDPMKFGFPKPSARINESRPVINTLILHHIGQGDLKVQADIERFEKKKVFFKDGSVQEYDLIMLATGYKLHYPFIDKKFLNWKNDAPEFYLNIFHPEYDNLFILGLIEAVAFNWEDRYEQARLAALFIKGLRDASPSASRFKEKKKGKNPDMTGGYKYEKGAGLCYHVNKDAYSRIVKKESRLF